ncbi:hypothetical protein [Micromonospora sp. NPDC050200]|uniref:hypothetical protein n=1 Tax=Micromonospora sp. NPDC050200 TaxID=3155664 RepID=UPI0033C1D619
MPLDDVVVGMSWLGRRAGWLRVHLMCAGWGEECVMGNFYERTSHRLYEFVVFVTAPVCGVLLVALNVRPQSVEVAMPDAIKVCWEFGLIVVGVAGLLGMFWPGQLGTGLGIELAAVLMLGAIAAMYVVAVLAVAGGQAVVAASFVGAVAVGSWLRSAEIVRSLRLLIRLHQAGADPCPEGQT